MSEAIVNQAAQQLAQQAQDQGAAAQQANLPTQEVDAADQVAFEQAMNGGEQATGVQEASSVDATTQTEACAGDNKCLGDAILDGLEHIKTSHDAHMDRIQKQLLETGGENMTVQDAMRLNFEVMQMGIEQDLTVKMFDKGSQGFQTLVRPQ
ncbi:MAG: hypothetical protein AAF596_00535 [Planctomycetota bacterium]